MVDSPDLSLNISRELLQHDRQLKIIAANLEKKIKAELERMLQDDREGYEKFYQNFGRQLKFGVPEQLRRQEGAAPGPAAVLLLHGEEARDPRRSTSPGCRESQKYIYFAAGETVDAIDHMPQTELLKDQQLWRSSTSPTRPTSSCRTCSAPVPGQGAFRSAIDGDLELGDEQKPDETAQPAARALPSCKEALAR